LIRGEDLGTSRGCRNERENDGKDKVDLGSHDDSSA
jgi:hypothetical protein